MEKASRNINFSFSMFGIGYMKNTSTITGQYKFVTRIYLIGIITISDTKAYYL
jgi:hypothetical protein